jgi:hypothetical protein
MKMKLIEKTRQEEWVEIGGQHEHMFECSAAAQRGMTKYDGVHHERAMKHSATAQKYRMKIF